MRKPRQAGNVPIGLLQLPASRRAFHGLPLWALTPQAHSGPSGDATDAVPWPRTIPTLAAGPRERALPHVRMTQSVFRGLEGLVSEEKKKNPMNPLSLGRSSTFYEWCETTPGCHFLNIFEELNLPFKVPGVPLPGTLDKHPGGVHIFCFCLVFF